MASEYQPQLVFVDGTFGELAQEMGDYLRVGEEVKPLIEQDQQDEVLKKIVTASAILNSAPEKEFTAAYNLLVYLVMQSQNHAMFLKRVCENLMKPITSSPANGPGLALGALTNIFNMLKPDDQSRYHVFMYIVRFVKMQGLYEYVKKYLPHLQNWTAQWDVDEESERQLYEALAETAEEAGDDNDYYEFIIKAVRTFDDEEVKSEEAQRLALRALKTAITSPSRYDFQDLMAAPAVQALQDSHPVYFELLEIFAEKDVEDYKDFCEEHEGFIEKEKLDDEKLYCKLRKLTFATLAAQSSTREIPYKDISHALQIPQEDVERWAIDVVRAGLVEGRLSQQTQTFSVHRGTYRVFGEKQWRELSNKIDSWRSTISTVVTSLRREQALAESAKRREQEELERKMANAGVDDGSSNKRTGGGRRDRDRGDRPPPKQRTDDDD